jgi:hypothetical protein
MESMVQQDPLARLGREPSPDPLAQPGRVAVRQELRDRQDRQDRLVKLGQQELLGQALLGRPVPPGQQESLDPRGSAPQELPDLRDLQGRV